MRLVIEDFVQSPRCRTSTMVLLLYFNLCLSIIKVWVVSYVRLLPNPFLLECISFPLFIVKFLFKDRVKIIPLWYRFTVLNTESFPCLLRVKFVIRIYNTNNNFKKVTPDTPQKQNIIIVYRQTTLTYFCIL